MVEFKRSNNKSIPTVIFTSSSFKLEASNWFELKMPVNELFGLILLKIGFSVDDTIIIKDYNDKDKSFNCVVNDQEIYNIKINNLNSIFDNMEIIKKYDNHEYGYLCEVLSVAELGSRIALSWHKEVLSNGIIFTRCFSRKYAKCIVQCGDYSLEFKTDKPDDMVLPIFDEDGHYAKVNFENEDKLVQYLSNLEFPISIVDVYKEICKISLSNVFKYPRLVLVVSKNGVVTDLIDLKYGNMELFTITRDNKIVTLNDSEGVISCEILDNSFSYSSSKKGGINCSFNANDIHELSKYTSSYVFDNVFIARREAGRARRLARELFIKR